MKDTFKNKIIVSPAMMLLTLVGIYFIIKTASPDIVVNKYPEPIIEQKVIKEIKVDLGDGWKCDKPEMDTDLLQPSGYWIGSTISCWKLETPIKEYRIEMCEKTQDDYWCNF